MTVQEERLNQNARRMRTTPRPAAYKPPSTLSRPSLPKKLMLEELHDISTKGLCLYCDKLWSRNHRCEKGKLSIIKPIEESKQEVQETKEENIKEEPQPANCTTHALAGHTYPQAAKVEESLKPQPVTVLIKTRSTNKFRNSKVAAQLMLQNEDCSRFNVEVADGQILKCDQRSPRVKLLRQDQEILTDFFLLPLDDYEVVLDIKWLSTLDDDSAQIHPPNTQVDEAQVQLMIAWDRRIMAHHRPVTTASAGPQEQNAPTIGAMREPHEELQIRTRRCGAQP
ncbi:hypothetical protein BHM03_00021972 [Ensete ventricosum]|nr:hypothetical protein BHM03_00021972 [Ensete ventricosum]